MSDTRSCFICGVGGLVAEDRKLVGVKRNGREHSIWICLNAHRLKDIDRRLSDLDLMHKGHPA